MVPESTPQPVDRPLRVTLLVFLMCLVVYHLNGRPLPEVDCVAAPYVAWSLARHGSLDLGNYADLEPYRGSEVLRTGDGRWVSFRPLGSALAALPFIAPLTLILDQPPRMVIMNHLGKLTAATMTAAAVALLYLLCRRRYPEAALPTAVLFGLGTCLWSVACQSLWMHGPAVFWVMLALSLLLPARGVFTERHGVLVGLVLGMAVLTRPTTAFFGLATAGLFVKERRWRDLLALGLGSGGPLLLLLVLNAWQFGHPLRGGYQQHDDWSQSTPLWLGVSGLLAAPSRGLLIYSPALIVAPLGLWVSRRRPEVFGVFLAWTLAVVATLLFYARWYDWRGGWCYGPRFLCETLPLLCLLFAAAYETLRPVWGRRLIDVLVGASVMVHLIGLAGYSGYANWHRRHDFSDQGRSLFAWQDTQIEAHLRAALAKGSRGRLERRE